MRWLRCREAAQHAHLSEKLIYRAAHAGKLRVVRIGAGRNWLTCEAWVDQWLLGEAGEPKTEDGTK